MNRLTTIVLERMTNAELEAVIGDAPRIDWTGFTDGEVEAVQSDQASPELLARVAAATHPEGPA